MPSRLTVAGLVVAALAVPGVAQATELGSLTQLAGTLGCVQEGSPTRCEAGRGLRGAGYVAVSPDDAYLYAVSFDGIAVFSRHATRGALTQLPGSAGCITDMGESRDPSCATVHGAFFAEGSMLALSPDGRNAYAANAAGITIFSRDPTTGELSQLPGPAGCLLRTLTSICVRGRGLDAPNDVVVSPDGRTVYVASHNSGAIAVFSRDSRNGALTQLAGTTGCVSVRRDEGCARGRALYGGQQLAISPDGRNLYLAAWGGVSAFVRARATGALTQLPGRSGCISRRVRGCAHVRGLGRGADSLALSPDRRYLYVGSTCDGTCGGSIRAFRRDRRSGALSPLRGRAGCASEDGGPHCSNARRLGYVRSLAISPDGRNAYSVGGTNVAVFSRSRRTGALRQLRGAPGLARGWGLAYTRWVALSSDGRNAYVAAEDSDAVAIFARRSRG